MAKFRYRMQNILEIKEKMEEQEKVAYGIANARLLEEQEKLQKLFVRKAGYEARLKELTSAKLVIAFNDNSIKALIDNFVNFGNSYLSRKEI